MARAGELSAKFHWPRWLDWALRGWLTVAAAIGLAVLADSLAFDLGIIPRAARWQAYWGFSSDTPPGWIEFRNVDPEGPMGVEGVVSGDRILPDEPYLHFRTHAVGDVVGFTLYHRGTISHHSLVMAPQGADKIVEARNWPYLLYDLSSVLVFAFSLLLLFRRWREPAPTCLALFLIGVSYPAYIVPHFVTSPTLALAIMVLQPFGSVLLTAFGPAFCHYLTNNTATRRRAALIWGWPALFFAAIYPFALNLTLLTYAPAHRFGKYAYPLMFAVEALLAIWILMRNYRTTDAAGRNRIKVVGAAFVGSSIGFAASSLANPTDQSLLTYATLVWLSSLLWLLSPLLLIYTVLRHKLFDFSFAVNRTLVYAIVSALLLGGFGLAEWAVHHLVPEQWQQQSALYSAGIALGLFLVFHRLRDWVEHHVERWFFRKWQANEAQMRQFIEAAGHYERQDSLMRDLVAEFRRFTGSDSVALFWKQDGEDYRRLHGGLGKKLNLIDADDPALARARVMRGAIAVEDARSTLSADLILPVIDHGQIVGFLALGAKPNSLGYRPDEIEVMAWAAQQAGLDLQSMRARGLEAKVTSLEAQVERLSTILSARTASA